uniref:Uncharacterized protein n=1 Tax=candidate division WOR-3 bacterium TaxID=2052148 RepID=A0A7C3UVZ5_UNCW3
MFSSSKITNLAKEIFEEILNLTEDKINLNEYCTTKLKSSFPELSDLEIFEILDKLVKKISVYINRRKEECESRNITPQYIISPLIPYILIRPGSLQKEEPLISFCRNIEIIY